MIIFKTTNLINGKIYIGKDKKNNDLYLGSGKILKLSIEKYGKENFKKEILEFCNSEEQLNEREVYWIKELQATDIIFGYNISKGGDGGDTISNNPNRERIIKKHSDWMKENNPTKGRKKTKDEINKWKISIGDKLKGEKHPMFGKTHTEAAKKNMSDARKSWNENLSDDKREKINKKISDSNKGKEGFWKNKENLKHSDWMKENNPFKGKKHTEESIKKISEANLNKPKSKEHKKKLSEATKKYMSEEYRKKISDKSPCNRKCIIDNILYESVTQASNILNIKRTTVTAKLKNDKFKNWYYAK